MKSSDEEITTQRWWDRQIKDRQTEVLSQGLDSQLANQLDRCFVELKEKLTITAGKQKAATAVFNGQV